MGSFNVASSEQTESSLRQLLNWKVLPAPHTTEQLVGAVGGPSVPWAVGGKGWNPLMRKFSTEAKLFQWAAKFIMFQSPLHDTVSLILTFNGLGEMYQQKQRF